MGRGSEQTFSQRRYMNGQQVHEKMLNVTNPQGNSNQNYSEMSHHTCRMAIMKKIKIPYDITYCGI